MSNKTESITNSLIKLYSRGNYKSEVKFRKKLENIDWDKEQKELKHRLSISKTGLRVMYGCFIFLIIILVIVIFKHWPSQIPLSAAIAVCAGCITTSQGFKQTSEKYQAFMLLRELLENQVYHLSPRLLPKPGGSNKQERN